MASTPLPIWKWDPWAPDISGLVGRVELPDAGGWMYQFRDPNAQYSHAFVPNMAIWAEAIAESIASPKNKAVSIASNLAAAKDFKQSIPGSGGTAD